MSTPLLLLALALSAPGPISGQVHVVDASGGPGSQYVDIQPAVTAAAPGDTVLVRTGGYGEFTVQGKGIVVTTDLGAFVEVPRFSVRDVPAGQSVRVHGIGTNALNDGPGLAVRDCVGPVWIEECALRGPLQALSELSALGAEVTASSAVSFHRSTLQGSFAYFFNHGGPGLRASGSLVALYDCEVVGGQGGNAFGSGVPLAAGPGAAFDGGTLYASGTAFTGGKGGSGAVDWGCVDAGDGAAGLVLDGEVAAHLMGSQATGGAGGTALPGCSDGAPGPGQLVVSGTVVEQSFPARSLEAANPVRPGETLSVAIDGVPGDVAFLWVSPLQAPMYVAPVGDPVWPIAGGVFLPDVTASTVVSAGTVTPGGTQLHFPIPTPVGETVHVHVQALLVSSASSGGFVVSSGQGITILASGL